MKTPPAQMGRMWRLNAWGYERILASCSAEKELLKQQVSLLKERLSGGSPKSDKALAITEFLIKAMWQGEKLYEEANGRNGRRADVTGSGRKERLSAFALKPAEADAVRLGL